MNTDDNDNNVDLLIELMAEIVIQNTLNITSNNQNPATSQPITILPKYNDTY